MNIKPTLHQVPESHTRANGASEASASKAAQGAASSPSSGSSVAQEGSDAIGQEVDQADAFEKPVPGKGKPTIVDLFPEMEDGLKAQTLMFPENGEPMPEKGGFQTKTLMFPENGEPMPEKGGFQAQTLRFPEDGGASIKPGKIPGHHEHHHGQTKAIGENGEPGFRPDKPGKIPGHHEHHHGQTKALGENGEGGGKPGKPGMPEKLPFPNFPHMTKAMGENGDFVKPPKPFPGIQPPGHTLAFPESGESWGKPGKAPPSPPCKCHPEKDEIIPLKPFPHNKILILDDEVIPLKPFPGTEA